MGEWMNGRMDGQMCRYIHVSHSRAPIHPCIHTAMHPCTNTPMHPHLHTIPLHIQASSLCGSVDARVYLGVGVSIRVHGFRVHGCVGAWPYVCMGAWTSGSQGVRVYGCVRWSHPLPGSYPHTSLAYL